MTSHRALRRMNDGSNDPPRLQVLQSWWGMIGVGEKGREWSVEEKLENIAQFGFAGIMGRLPFPESADRWRRRLDDYQFTYGVHCFPWKTADVTDFLHEIRNVGANFVNAHIMDSFVVGESAVALIRDMIDEASRHGMPFFVETHRGRVTQDVHRTIDYVTAIPDLRLTIDLSHYAIAGEMEQIGDKEELLFDRLLARTSSIHGRISNGQQVQVDIGPKADHPLAEPYVRLWSNGMLHWLAEAAPGDILPVLPELGPPPYAITADGSADVRFALSDRWQQALVIKSLFERAWDEAQRRYRSGDTQPKGEKRRHGKRTNSGTV